MWFKYQNKIENVFRDIKLPLGYTMGHWKDILESLWGKVQKNAPVRYLEGILGIRTELQGKWSHQM